MSYISGIGGQQTGNAITSSGDQPVVSEAPGIVADRYEVVSATVGHADETAVSSTGGLVFQALDASDTRTAKVLSLQEAIAVGSYKVSSSDVANKIIQSLMK